MNKEQTEKIENAEQTISQFLNIKEKDFPFKIKDKNGKTIYYEDSTCWFRKEFDESGNQTYAQHSNGFWSKREYDENGNVIYYEDFNNSWWKQKFDKNGNVIYFENSLNYWWKQDFDENGEKIYYEDSKGKIVDNRNNSLHGKTIEIDGKTYTLQST